MEQGDEQGRGVNVRKEAKKPFLDIQEEFKGAIVYLDGPAAEIVQWTFGGLDFFFGLGAEHVTLLPPASNGNKDEDSHSATLVGFTSTRALIFISSYLPEYRDSLKRVLESGTFTECVVYSGLPESAHSHYPELGGGLFNSYIRMMKDWMRKKQTSKFISPVAVVIPFPLLYSPFLPHTFFLPPCYDVFPPVQLPEHVPESPHGPTLEQLPKHYQLAVKRLANVLSQTMRQWGLKEDIYPIGHAAKFTAGEMNKLAEQAQHAATPASPRSATPVSLILIDRTIDLVAPMRHTANVLDRIRSVLRSPSPTSNDVAIDLRPFLSDSPVHMDDNFLPYGSLIPREDSKASNSIFKTLATKTQKDALNAIRKKLMNSSAVTPARLLALLRPFQTDVGAFYRHAGLMQYAAGVISALQQSDKSTAWEELMGVEKLIIHTVKDPSEKSSLQQLVELLSVGKFTAADVVGLAVMAHSLLGQRFARDDDKAFQKALVANLIDFPQESLDWLGDADVAHMLRQHYRAAAQEGSAADDAGEGEREVLARQLQLSLKDVIEDRMDRLRGTADVRSSLKLRDYANVMGRGAGGAAYTSLVARVARDSVTRDGDAELHDLEKHTSTVALSDLLGMASSLGLGRFGFGRGKTKAKPRPSDNKTIVIFVIGGITCAEIQEALQQVADSVGGKEEGDDDQYQVLIGSTSLSTASGVLSHLFAAEQQQ
ncbi:Sec1 family domain containing protein [Acanthamoeba castellanii str. Neff]|uniref:Sec1 family domain containing protein n=1 Tax=Acanthamoeba castellanii (strain ATCC 30010 / Neff) TaxID=1257118 RepID=L8HHN4_ACACF|nr:Sec1 family domain containing protein [Acanthamoeba castellanii str. Neff]ELR23951.1 Sec1 family domain containing protein [Acanthamoeba castellanii str. Neff]